MSSVIAPTAIIYPGVELGDDVIIEDFCVIGTPARGQQPGEECTRIGSGAHIRSHTVIYAGNTIGSGFQTGNKVNIREHNTIGDDVSIGTLSTVEHHIKIMNGARLHSQVFIPEYCILEENVWIGPHVVLTNARYPASPGAKATLQGVTVKRGARLGANTTVLPGLTIGADALVGAGAVVTRDVLPGMVWAGTPARPLRPVSETGAYGKDE